MWVYVVTSFTRYSKVGREAQNNFERDILKDGFHHLHLNLYVRYCFTASNAVIHKERVKELIPRECYYISLGKTINLFKPSYTPASVEADIIIAFAGISE